MLSAERRDHAPEERWTFREARTGLWLAGLLLLCFLYFLPRPGDWNQDARLDLTLSLVNHGSVAIDGYQWNTGVDSVHLGRHYYINKAPGQSLLGVPIYAAVKIALSAAGDAASVRQIGLAGTWHRLYAYFYLLQYVETMYTVAIPATLFLLLVFWFLGFLSSSLPHRVLVTVGLGLGTSVFAYAQGFYSHVSGAALLFVGFVILYLVGRGEPTSSKAAAWLSGHPSAGLLLAGFSLGLATVFDLTCAIIAVLVGLYGLTRVSLRLTPWLVVGAAPCLLTTFAYDLAAYHNIGITGYSTGGSGVGGSDARLAPHGSGLIGLTFSPYRGLFFLSPFLLLALPGLAIWRKRGGLEAVLFLAIPVTFTLAISTVSYWYGGVSVGPRYLIPMLPFLAVPVVLALDGTASRVVRLAMYALFAVSIAVTWIETLGGKGYPAVGTTNPLFTYSLPALAHGRLPLSMGTVLVAPFAGVNSKWSVVPLLVALLAWTWWALRPRRTRAEAHRSVPASA